MKSSNRNFDRSRSPIRSKKSGCKKVFVSNIPFEYKWKELKELFNKEVGDVAFVVLYKDENEKPRGCATIEFNKAETVQKAIKKMHRFDINGRRLVIKEDDVERNNRGYLMLRGSRNTESGSNFDVGSSEDRTNNRMSISDNFQCDSTYGLSPKFLETLDIRGPLINRIFIANLDYKVDETKLQQVFKLAGRIVDVEIFTDKHGKSKGYGIVEYRHPVEAVQAISMFNNQILFERPMSIRFDRTDPLARLPEGLKSIGRGLGPSGTPLHGIERNLSNNTSLIQPQALSTPVKNSALAVMSGLSTDKLGIATHNQCASQGVKRLGNLSASNLGIASLGPVYGSGLNTSGGGSMNNSSLHQNSGNIRMGQKKSDTIMVINLPPGTTWQVLKDFFFDCGDIKFAEVRNEFGVVQFTHEWLAERAKNLKHLSRFNGHVVEVVYF
ncbi:RNA recognition motif domain [Cinara cedri]|uniref:RNA recognition motif domain n=1 Tax=Cinara cedri TaxID=506608 RepID=A0A5E4N4N8_9HEMI|nr:RNA recognition motif domain [Cinara cedri]